MKWLKDNFVSIASAFLTLSAVYVGREKDLATMNLRMVTVEKANADAATIITTLTERAIVSVEDRRNIHAAIDAANNNNEKRFDRIETKIDKIADAVGVRK